MSMPKERFEKIVKPILTYVGTIGAIMMGIAYIGIVLVMVFGFSAVANFMQSITFAVVNAAIGLVIMQFLKVQGITFAKELEEHKETLTEYYNTKTKDRKFHSLKYFWITSFIGDFIIKGLTLASTTLGIIYVVIQGSSNYTLLLLAFVNLIMFACFGLLSLVKAYDFFNEQHIPYLKEKINEYKREKEQEELLRSKEQAAKDEAAAKEREKIIQAEVDRRVGLVEKELIKQRDIGLYADRGSDILDTSVGSIPACDNIGKPLVLYNHDSGYSILGRSVYTSCSATNSPDSGTEEGLAENSSTEERKE